jgi:hypothetical protein
VNNIATAVIHSKLDYCNSIILNQSNDQVGDCQVDHGIDQLDNLQLVLYSAAHAATNTLELNHITHILKPLHWQKRTKRVNHKILSFTHRFLLSNKPLFY